MSLPEEEMDMAMPASSDRQDEDAGTMETAGEEVREPDMPVLTQEELLHQLEKIRAKEKRLSDWETSLQRRALELGTKELDLTEREHCAEKGFLQEQMNVLDRLRDDLDDLRGQIHAAEEELAQKKRDIVTEAAAFRQETMLKQDRELNQRFTEIQQEQDERHDDLLREIDSLRDEKSRELTKEFEKRRGELDEELEGRRNALKTAEDDIQIWLARLSEQEKALRTREIGLKAAQEAQDADKRQYREELEAEYREKLSSALEYAEQMRQSVQAQDAELAEFRKRDGNAGGRSREQLKEEISSLKKLLEEAKKERPAGLSASEKEYLEKGKLYGTLYEEKEKAEAECSQLREKLLQQEMFRADVNMAQMRCERLEIQRNALEQELERCKETIQRLKIDYLRPEEEAARIKDIETSRVLKKGEADPGAAGMTERAWLDRTHRLCEESNFQISPRLLCSFHTALKTAEWSPITVLAGVSGTGKSMLPKLYARFGGLYFLSLPVQPDWDSSQSLFGFFNAIDNKFNATNLLTAMVQMQSREQPEIADKMLLVLLDEMNLAHVELYFSELLSKLEERRGEGEGAVAIDIDLGSGLPKYPVALSRNVLWVGTMNEDETTKTLSDKVIDRSSVLTFPRPAVFARREQSQLAAESKLLPRKQWEEWRLKQRSLTEDDIKDKKAATEAINQALAITGRALGHRVWQSIEHYIANHPYVIEAGENGDKTASAKYMQMAFEEALVQKVMPKLRGIELTDSIRKGCMEPIRDELTKHAAGLLPDYQDAISDDSGLFLWRSSRYLGTSYD